MSTQFDDGFSSDLSLLSEPLEGPVLAGQGVEQEVIQLAVNQIFDDETAQHFIPRLDDKLVFAPSTDDPSIPSSPMELELAARVGIFTALSWLRLGRLPEKISGLQVAFCLYRGDLDALDRELINYVAPGFVEFIDRWRAAGHEGNIDWAQPMFVSYLDLDVSGIKHVIDPFTDRFDLALI